MPITVHDEAYNANPLSMGMALETFASLPVQADEKLVILGDMLELGEEADTLHLHLAPHISAVGARRVLLCGLLCQTLVPALGGEANGVFHYPDVKTLKESLMQHLRPGDNVLVKASHGVGLYSLFADSSRD
jgi:UDP-N-acetylmuramyl pentapeptide synthase